MEQILITFYQFWSNQQITVLWFVQDQKKIHFGWEHWTLVNPFTGPIFLWSYFLSGLESMQGLLTFELVHF